MNPPFVSLGFYYPKVWRSWVIGDELTAFTHSKGLVPHKDLVHGPLRLKTWYSVPQHAEVRAHTLRGEKAKRGTDWHQDGDLDPGSSMNCALVTWASVAPTEFQYQGQVYQPEPFEVVIARNLAGYHRRPPDAPYRRWLFRQRVQVPRHLNLP